MGEAGEAGEAGEVQIERVKPARDFFAWRA
jgi:hypothetical protein